MPDMTTKISSNSAEIRDIFEKIAPHYDQLNDWLSLGQHRIWKKMAVKWAAPQAGDTCIDLCCGSGDLTKLLAKEVGKQGKVYGVDFSPQQMAIGKEKFPLPQIEWVEADVLDLPFPDNNFDAATMGYGLRNVVDIPRSLEEIYRVLKPGAKAAILDFHLAYQPYLQQFEHLFLVHVAVPLAERFGLRDEYAYIWDSLQKFPQGTQQVELAKQVGFAATHYPIVVGTMGVLVVTKPEA